MAGLGGDGSGGIGFQGEIKPNRYVLNRGKIVFSTIAGLTFPDIYFTECGELNPKLGTVVLPDKTSVSSGQSEPMDWTLTVPMHHTNGHILFSWYAIANGVQLPYKTTAHLYYFRSGRDANVASVDFTKGITGVKGSGEADKADFQLFGAFPDGFTAPAINKGEDGGMANLVWSFKVDGVFPLSIPGS